MLKKLAKRFIQDEQGLELSEYAVMVALIAMVVIAVIEVLGPTIAGKFDELNTKLTGTP